MTMVCCDTPITRTAPAATLGAMVRRAAGRLATKLNGLARTIAEHHRARRDRAALEALPFDLRKDLGWPAGDTAR